MLFRKDINGLRAIAVIAVVLFHFNASWMPGGFAGVDVFFVISGFLMTGIIFRGLEKDNFSILSFYIARANRIIPALAVLCLVLLVIGWFYLTPLDYKALGKHVGGSLSFLSNIVYNGESGYFDSSSHEKWLLHTWSLSTEWQFYIIYPLVLVAMRKLISLQALKKSILAGTLIGFILCVVITFYTPSSAYYLLPARAWEMMIGGVAYLYPFSIQEKRKQQLEWLGLTLIISSYFFISKDNPWPGYLAILPVVGTFLVIQAQRSDSLITGNIVFQKLGTWSYSIYLWHWPLVVAIYYLSLNEAFIYLGMTLSVVLGFLSNKYIERIKFRNDFSNLFSYLKCKPAYMAILVGMIGSAVFLSSGLDLNYRKGASTPQAKFLNQYEQALKNLNESYWLKCNTYHSLNNDNTLATDPTCVEKKGAGGVFLWGDSHSEALSFGLRQLLQPLAYPFYQKASSSCKASLRETTNLKGMMKTACDHSNKLALDSISKLKPKLVIIAQENSHDKTNWPEIYNKLSSMGVEHVFLIGPTPQWKPSLPRVMIKPNNWRSGNVLINDSGLDMSIIETDAQMEMIKLPKGLEYISLIDKLCQHENSKYYCRTTVKNGALLQMDYGHLSKEGSQFITNTILADNILKVLGRDVTLSVF